jgi:hypothetical protein
MTNPASEIRYGAGLFHATHGKMRSFCDYAVPVVPPATTEVGFAYIPPIDFFLGGRESEPCLCRFRWDKRDKKSNKFAPVLVGGGVDDNQVNEISVKVYNVVHLRKNPKACEESEESASRVKGETHDQN